MSPLLVAILLLFAPAPSFAANTPSRDEIVAMARQYADLYGLPHDLVLHTVKRESRFNPAARNGPYWGLMQIRYDTAKGVGYRGTAAGLLDPEVNLIYGTAYLANAYLVAGGSETGAHRLYRRGYYYEAKRKKLLGKLLKSPPIAQPQVMLASVLPEPKLALTFAREPEPSAALEAVTNMPLPVPKPAEVAALSAEPAPAADRVAADVSAPTFDAAAEPVEAAAVPLPRRKPGEARPTIIASSAIPLPKPRPLPAQ